MYFSFISSEEDEDDDELDESVVVVNEDDDDDEEGKSLVFAHAFQLMSMTVSWSCEANRFSVCLFLGGCEFVCLRGLINVPLEWTSNED